MTSPAERLVISSGVVGGEMIVVSPIRGASAGMRLRSLDADGTVLPDYSATIESEVEDDEASDSATESSDGEAVASAG